VVSLEEVRRVVADAEVIAFVCGCELCGHLWMAPKGPARYSQCEARRWGGVHTRSRTDLRSFFEVSRATIAVASATS
jgi:hypothetical protein